MKQENPKAHGLAMSPPVQECQDIRNEMQIITKSPKIFNLQLRDEIMQLWGWDWLPSIEWIYLRPGLCKWAVTEERKSLLWEERNVVMWLLFTRCSPALEKFSWDEVTLGRKNEVLPESTYEGLSYRKYNSWPTYWQHRNFWNTLAVPKYSLPSLYPNSCI